MYKHPYGGMALDMRATREQVLHYVGHDPAQYWAPNCKVLNVQRESGELVVYSTNDPAQYVVTHIMR